MFLSDARRPEVVFFHFFDGGFTQIFGQIVFIIVKTFRNTNLVASGALKWKRPHFRLTGVAQSRRHSSTGFKARLDMKMIFHSHANKTHFHLKGFVRSLVLKAWDHYFGQQIPFIENLLNCELQDSFLFGRIGLDLIEGKVRDNKKAGVLEPSISKIKCLKFATEAAITILRIDDMIKLRPEKKDEGGYEEAVRRGEL